LTSLNRTYLAVRWHVGTAPELSATDRDRFDVAIALSIFAEFDGVLGRDYDAREKRTDSLSVQLRTAYRRLQSMQDRATVSYVERLELRFRAYEDTFAIVHEPVLNGIREALEFRNRAAHGRELLFPKSPADVLGAVNRWSRGIAGFPDDPRDQPD